MSRRTYLPLLFVAVLACETPTTKVLSSLLQDVQIAVRGHTELQFPPGGRGEQAQPLFLSANRVPGLCLQAPASRDTTRWKMRFRYSGMPAHDEFRAAVEQLGRTVCFDAPFPDGVSDGSWTVHAELIDDFDGRRASLPGMTFRYRSADTEYDGLQGRFRTLMAERNALSTDELVRRLDQIGTEASDSGFPFLELRTRLVRVFMLRRTGRRDSQRAAADLLARRPAWLDGPHADVWSAQHSYERASLLMEAWSDPAEIWSALTMAEERYRRIADPRRITVVMKQADVLSMAGSPQTGRVRLAEAIAECTDSGCAPRFVGAAKNTLAWLTLQDPQATGDELRAVAVVLHENVEELEKSDDLLERANALVNLAYAEARIGVDPSLALNSSSKLLARMESEPERGAWIAQWGRLAAAIYAATVDRADRALALCEQIGKESTTPDLTARSLGCIAKAHRTRGDLAAAYDAIQRALFLDEFSTRNSHPWTNTAGPSQRAYHVMQAAQLALDLMRPAESWDLVASLEIERSRPNAVCAPLQEEAESARWNELLLDLAELEGPASEGLRAKRDQIRPVLMVQAQQLLHQRWGCPVAPSVPSVPAAVDYRAFVVDDRIVVLRRHRSGATELYRTTGFPEGTLGTRLASIGDAVQNRNVNRSEWMRLTGRVAEALIPRAEDLGEETTFALHGALQRVPLIAMPMPESDDGEYLSDRTLVKFRPGAFRGSRPGLPPPGRSPLFIVDPLGNLQGAAEMADHYRALFPGARILQAQEASAGNVSAALADASWFHIDAHGTFDVVFPELSRVRLADALAPTIDWAEAAGGLEFANLSMCGSGRWPITADAGRFGIAGRFARNGARWVVAAQADLPNRVALEFNRRFYVELSASGDVPASFRAALRRVRDRFEPAQWASLLLLEGWPAGEKPAVAGSPGSIGGVANSYYH